jgi:hypothetical protein
MAENAIQLSAHRGPYFDHWLERMRSSFGVAVDDTRPSE